MSVPLAHYFSSSLIIIIIIHEAHGIFLSLKIRTFHCFPYSLVVILCHSPTKLVGDLLGPVRHMFFSPMVEPCDHARSVTMLHALGSASVDAASALL